MAINFDRVGTEVQVNTGTSVASSQGDPDIAGLTDGRFLVTFTTFSTVPGEQNNIVGQFVNADGTLAGPEVLIDSSAGIQFGSAVAFRPADAAYAVWVDVGGISGAPVSSAGLVGGKIAIIASGFSPDIAQLADGRAFVVSEFGTDLWFNTVSPGDVAGVAMAFDAGTGNQGAPAVAASGNNALVVFTDEDSPAPSGNIVGRLFDGTNIGPRVTIADHATGLVIPDVAALTDGRFVVVYRDGDVNCFAQIVDAAGNPVGAEITLGGGGSESSPRVAALPDGGFIVTWDTLSGPIEPEAGVNLGIYARRFLADGTPGGDLFIVNQATDTSQGGPAVAANSAGNVFIAFQDSGVRPEDANPPGVRGDAFLLTTNVINGTGSSDIIQTYNLGEAINGLDGDDTINAFGGADVVHGGAGIDLIAGGFGNDQIFGEAGSDLLKGEEGDDLLVGGTQRDLLIGGLGKDTFDFNAVAESRAGLLRDLIKGFSHAEHDKIDVKTIDADTTAAGNQAFDLIGTSVFSGTAGELRFAGGVVQGDTNGDGVANFEIRVTGLGIAVNGDFVL